VPAKPYTKIISGIALALLLAGCGSEQRTAEDPAAPSGSTDPKILTESAKAKQAIGAYKEAIAELQQAIQIDPNFQPAHYRMGSVYAEWDKQEMAEKAFKKSIELKPNHMESHLGLGAVYSKMVLNELTIEEHKKVAAARPNDPEIRFKIALEYWYLQKFPETAEYYRQVLNLKPDHRQAHLNIASVYEAMKDWDRAMAHVHRAMELGKAAGDQQTISIAEGKLSFFKGRVNLTPEELEKKSLPPFN